jgi:heme-degrading monooxygenase HmoA
MATITEDSDVFTVIVLFETEPAHQQELIDAITAEVDRWISDLPGFVSSPFHESFDGARVVNYTQWETIADWKRFVNYEEGATLSEGVAQLGYESFGDNNTSEVEYVAEG